MSNESNMKLWDSVSTTDPKYTKADTSSGRKSTSINGTYMMEQATEAFGPNGIGWGYDIVEERLEEGMPIYSNINDVKTLEGYEKTKTIKLKLWYIHNEVKGEITDFGHTKYLYYSRRNGYWICDEQAGKKTLTDSIKRCLSKIGICADIFKGEFDSQEYQAEAAQITHVEKEKASIDKREAKQKLEVEEHQKFIDDIADCGSAIELKRLWPIIDARALLMSNGPKRVQELMKLHVAKLKGFEND